MQTVGEYVARTLTASGVDVVFGYPGQSNLVLLAAMRSVGIRYVQAADERGAGFAAVGYIQATERPTVVCASKGPAATNLLTPLVAAKEDGVPVIALTANVEAHHQGLHGFQSFEPVQAFEVAGGVKAGRSAREAGAVPELLREVCRLAWTEPYGPTVLDFPADLLAHELAAEPEPIEMAHPGPCEIDWAGQAAVARAREHLLRSRRPVIIVGRGARRAASEVRSLSITHNIPVVHTMGGTGVMPSTHSLYGGLLRHNGSREAACLVSRADVLLVLGASLDERATGQRARFATGATKIQVDLDPCVLARAPVADVPVQGRTDSFLRHLEAALPRSMRYPPYSNERAARHLSQAPFVNRDGPLLAREIVRAAERVMLQAVVVKDSGSHKYWVTNHAGCTSPDRSVASCHFGVMGFGIPAAIGASIGRPEDTVVATCGDGGILMSLPELVTAVSQKCDNLKILVFNNAGLGSTRDYERRTCCNGGVISSFGRHHPIALYARAMGIESYSVVERADLAAFGRALESPGLMLFDCWIDPTEPMRPSVSYEYPLEELISADAGPCMSQE